MTAEAQRKPRVLIADDEWVIAYTLATLLNSHGFDAVAVDSGQAAIETAQAFPADFVMLGFVMLDMRGDRAARKIQRLLPGAKITIITELVPEEVRAAWRAEGLDFDLLPAPIHPEELLHKLQATSPF